MCKRMKYAFNLGAILLVLLTIAGCASSGMVENASPILIRRPVSLDFVLVETSSSVASLGSETVTLKDSIISGIQQRQIFGTVSGIRADAGLGGGLAVRADIKQIRKVSDNAQTWLGALAGRAQILLQVTVTDLGSGSPVETFEAEGQSGESARAGTTNEAIDRAAEQVVAELVRISSQTAQ